MRFLLLSFAVALVTVSVHAQDQKPEPRRGLIKKEAGAMPGFTLIAPLQSKTIYLVDLDGKVVHQWETGYTPGCEYLLPNGNLLRCSHEPKVPRFKGGGLCGRLQEIAWDGKVVWDWLYADDKFVQHHDIAVTPDGTILFIAWEYKSRSEAYEAGRDPTSLSKDGLWPDSIIEVQPTPPNGGEIVWEWHVWDHLVQDRDRELKNYAPVEEHPELIDINADLEREQLSDADTAKLKALGYVGASPNRSERQCDWLHTNAIAYNADLDQIVISSPHLCEVWIIDHSTTIKEAASHSGGHSGRGGDLLYRWGNPKNYRAGEKADQRLFYQHNIQWIRPGLPGGGHLLVFNNGSGRPQLEYSSILELVPPLLETGGYARPEHGPYGPAEPAWEYTAADKKSFFSGFISGTQRLPNGNTLICEGQTGRVFEVTTEGRTVWEYLNPYGGEDPANSQGGPPGMPHALFRATRIVADYPGLAGKW